MKNLVKVDTFLPVFKGCYGNYWEEFTPYDEHGEELPWERYDIDSKAMLESIGKGVITYLGMCTELWEKLGIEDMEFQSSYSPAYYNFSNDSINIEVTINTKILAEYVYNNWDRYTKEGAKDLADATIQCWEAILKKDLHAFGTSFLKSFHAQIAMFPNMFDESIKPIIDKYASKSIGYKLSGAGGGGYLILIAEKEIENAIQIKIRRKNLM